MNRNYSGSFSHGCHEIVDKSCLRQDRPEREREFADLELSSHASHPGTGLAGFGYGCI